MSANIAAGGLADDLRDARGIAAADGNGTQSPGARGTNPGYAKGALVAAAVGPGLAPFVGARVGIGNAFEGGLAYTGRAARVDLRRSFDGEEWSLSLGVGGSAALYGRQQGSDLPNVDLGALHGWGADVPILVGWQSLGGLYSLWFGPRAGVEWVKIEQLTSEPKSVSIGTPPIDLEATRFSAGGVVGIATGFNHIHVALEAQLGFQTITGEYNGNHVNVNGLSFTPASALWWDF